jgi:pilus assembly protein CpaC
MASNAHGGVSRTIVLPVNKSAAFRLDGPVGEVVVAQPEIAQIVATTDQSFYVRGKALGGTNILVYDRGKNLVEVIDVQVGQDAGAIESDIAAALPGEKVSVRSVGKGVYLAARSPTAVRRRACVRSPSATSPRPTSRRRWRCAAPSRSCSKCG